MWFKINKMRQALTFVIFSISIIVNAQQTKNYKHCICNDKWKYKHICETFEVDKKPQYPGGDAQLIQYLAEHVKYPENQDDMQSTVYVRFAINKKGKVSKACIMRPFYGNTLTDLEKEVLRIIETLPDWIPGEHKGKKVSVWFIIPLRICLR